MELQKRPEFPKNVKYALTLSQPALCTYLSFEGNTSNYFNAAFGINYQPQYLVYDAGEISWNYDNDSDFIQKLSHDRTAEQTLLRFISSMEYCSRQVERLSTTLEPETFRRSEEINDLWIDISDYWKIYRLHLTSLFTYWNIEHYAISELQEVLRGKGLEKEINVGLGRFLTPQLESLAAAERALRAKLVSRFPWIGDNNLDQNRQSNLNALAKQFDKIFGFIAHPLFAADNVNAKRSVNEIKSRLLESATEVTQLSADSLNNLPRDVRELGLLVQRLAFWKAERLDVAFRADEKILPLYQKLAESFDLELSDFMAMTPPEIENSVQTKSLSVNREILTKRQSGYGLAFVDGKITFFEPSANNSPARSDKVVSNSGTELTGLGTYPATATGRVKKVESEKDLSDVKVGDIIVTKMTRPEMGVALDRAAAFVTDEGGYLCHAAQISREMQKPAVVGVENATSVLENGMQITVDGKNGIITVC